jgi:hypothetical protein
MHSHKRTASFGHGTHSSLALSARCSSSRASAFSRARRCASSVCGGAPVRLSIRTACMLSGHRNVITPVGRRTRRLAGASSLVRVLTPCPGPVPLVAPAPPSTCCSSELKGTSGCACVRLSAARSAEASFSRSSPHAWTAGSNSSSSSISAFSRRSSDHTTRQPQQ